MVVNEVPSHDPSGVEIPKWKREMMAKKAAEKAKKRGHTKKGQTRGRLEDGRNARLEETIDRKENGRSQKYILCGHGNSYLRIAS